MHTLWRLPLSLLQCSLLANLIFSVSAAPGDAPSAASFYVPSLPGLDVDASQPLHIYAGHMQSTATSKSTPVTEITPHIFFFMMKARRLADKERIIFWFNGGPGCSSFDGLLLECGSLRSDGKGGLKLIDGGWDEYTTVVFVDQPVGTGFSYTSTDHYVHELGEAADHVVQFMRNFYNVFPEYKSTDTYFAGESYAGQYIPYIGDAILRSNLPTPLKGLAIGNGWIDGESQYPAYLEFALQHDIIKESSEFYSKAKEVTDGCAEKFKNATGPPQPSLGYCEEITSAVLEGLTREIAGKKVCMNIYDIRLSDTYPACGANWPPELAEITPYLRRRDVVEAMHATAKSEAWSECQSKVSQELHNKDSAASIVLLPSLLEQVSIMLFSGDQDFICNHIGTEKLIANLEWNGLKGLGDANELPWAVNGVGTGTWVTARNLTYVKIYNASHMVPYDLPLVAHDMMLRFMGVDFSKLAGGSAAIPSKVGNDTKPALEPVQGDADKGDTAKTPIPGKTAEQDKAMWEAYYNAGSAALTLFVIGIIIGLFFYCRQRRRRRTQGTSLPSGDLEETIPLSHRTDANGYHDADDEDRNNKPKHLHDPEETVFEVGDSDGEEDRTTKMV